MTAPVLTGIEAVDRELERHAPFDSVRAAEAMAAKLMAAWRTLAPWSGANPTAPDRKQRQR